MLHLQKLDPVLLVSLNSFTEIKYTQHTVHPFRSYIQMKLGLVAHAFAHHLELRPGDA